MGVRHLALILFTTALSSALAQNLTDDQIALVVARLADGAKQSWELGTRAQALIELDTPTFSVLNNSALPPPTSAPASLATVLELATAIVVNRSRTDSGKQGPQPLIQDGAAGDPASNGVGVLIANWTGQGNSSVDFAGAATDQLNFLFQDVPQTSDGAISHRTEQVQLWSDFVYMVPPFLAYYGVITANRTLLEQAYTQAKLYRKYLQDPAKAAGGLWQHIVLGTGVQDPGHWSTGNAWAAAGMMRVLGTISNSQFAGKMKGEQKDLKNWVIEIHNGMYPHLQSNGLFFNYADDNTTFSDASSTALLASTVYRLALLTGTHTHLPFAEKSRQALSATNSSAPAPSNSTGSSATTGLAHFTSAGWLTPVVNPESFGQEGSQSPEGQAFVVEMHAAWRDWVQNGAPGANAARRAVPAAPLIFAAAGAALTLVAGALVGW